jgi:hypothetical protein
VAMRIVDLIVGAALAAGCGSKEPPQAESPSNVGSQSSQGADDPNRRLAKSECDSLAQSIVEACNSRGNDRSTEADGWCSDMVTRNSGDGVWVGSDCVPHFRYMDLYCFQSSRNAHGMMVCDKTVDRTR